MLPLLIYLDADPANHGWRPKRIPLELIMLWTRLIKNRYGISTGATLSYPTSFLGSYSIVSGHR